MSHWVTSVSFLSVSDNCAFYLRGSESRILKINDPMEKVIIFRLACAKGTVVIVSV